MNITSQSLRAAGVAIRGQQPAAATTRSARRGMNGTEAAYAAHLGMRQLAGEIVGWKFEAVKLRLADGAFYKPDFLILFSDGRIEFVETKGGLWREAARVRFRVARELFSPIVFRAIRKGEGGFYEEQV
jgi:hypothetical protein